MTAASAAAGAASAAALSSSVAAGQISFKSNAESAKASQPFSPRLDVDTADQAAEDAEEIVIAWLAPLLRTVAARKAGDVLPMAAVTQVAGTENLDEGTAAPIVSVHTLCAKLLGRNNLKLQTRATHQRMLRLGVHCDLITLTDGRQVGIDYVDVTEQPITVDYEDDQILRKVGRYEIGLSYVPTG